MADVPSPVGCDPISNENGEPATDEARWAESNLESFGEFCFETDNLALKGIFNLVRNCIFCSLNVIGMIRKC